MSGDLTRPMPTGYPPGRLARRRRRRGPLALLVLLVVIVVALVVADRAAAAYAGSQAAKQMQSHGFPGKPTVTMEGFPFLTQVARRNLQDVHITASRLREGPVTASLVADATGVRLNPGYQSGVVSQAHGTVLISFASLASVAENAGAPGVTASADGGNRIKFKVNLQFFTTTMIASISRVGPQKLQFHIISAGGLPASLLGSFSNLTFSLPPLPYGIAIQSVSVTSQGLVGRLTARDIHFTR